MSKPTNERKKQWLWFAALWCGGILTVFAISLVIKMIFAIAAIQ